MSNGPEKISLETAELPPWSECDYFCIREYAGTGARACGWRGHSYEARPDHTGTKLACPRCGCPTLLRIRLDRAGRSEGERAGN